jgi:CRP-like cAMP-binding protein
MLAGASPARPASPRKNLLLGALSETEYQQVLPHLERRVLPLGRTLYESGARMDYLLFPTEGIVSLLTVMGDGATAEIASTGSEGVVGTSLFMGGGNTPSRAIVQSAGNAYLLRESALKEQLKRRSELKQMLLRYSHELIMQAARSAMCNRYHSLDQHLCRWLLSSVDRLPTGELQTTEELVGDILSADRNQVAEVAGRLEDAGLIRYQRGLFTVLDRAQIEQRSCECYAVLKRETDRLRPYRES